MLELKLVTFSLLLPLLLLAFAFIYRKKRILSTACFVIGFLWVYLPSTPLVAFGLAEYWEKIPPFNINRSPVIKAQAIVILSGAYNRNIMEYPANRTISPATLERIRYGATIAKLRNLPVLTAGGIFDRAQSLPLAEQMAETLTQEFNVPVEWQERKSTTTAGNAKFSAQILAKDGVDTIFLVTDALHMPRAMMSFEHYGFNVLPAPTIFQKNYTHRFIFRLIPRAWCFEISKRVFHEMLGYWVYKHFTLS